MAVAHSILSRKPLNINYFNVSDAFELGAPHDIPSRSVLDDLCWTLFTFDFAKREAVFLDIGADCDLSAAPFSYDMQYAAARRLLRLPFDQFIALAGQITSHARLVHLFNIGHCGSTLLHHIFNRANGVWCLSEPLFTFDAAMRRGECSGVDLRQVLFAAMQFLQLFPGARDADMVIVKHFSQSTSLICDYHSAQPTAKCLFLYRQGIAWCNSHYRFIQRFRIGLRLDTKTAASLWSGISGAKPQSALDGIVDMSAKRVGFDALAAVAWVLDLRDEVMIRCKDVPLVLLRYEELNAYRAQMIGLLFDQCGIAQSNIKDALLGFDGDAHTRGNMEKSHHAIDFTWKSILVVKWVFRHRLMAFPEDTVLPGTLMPLSTVKGPVAPFTAGGHVPWLRPFGNSLHGAKWHSRMITRLAIFFGINRP